MKIKEIIIVSTLICHTQLESLSLPTFEDMRSWFAFAKTEDQIFDYPATYPAKLIVLNASGNTHIETWNLPRIKITAAKQARTDEALAHITIQATIQQQDGQSTVHVETHMPEEEKGCVDYTIFVPQGTSIRVSHHEKGSISIKETNTNSTLSLGNIHAYTNKGSITIHADNPIAQNIMLKTEKGSVKLHIPATTQARIEAQARHGAIISTLPITLEPMTMILCDKNWKHMTQNIKGIIGTEAEAFIDIDVIQGNIMIGKE